MLGRLELKKLALVAFDILTGPFAFSFRIYDSDNVLIRRVLLPFVSVLLGG